MTMPPTHELVEKLPGRQTVLVTGATGFIGSRLVASLARAGHQVIALIRNPAKAEILPPPIMLVTSLDQIADDARIDAIVNLAGEPIGACCRTRRSATVSCSATKPCAAHSRRSCQEGLTRPLRFGTSP
jgi:NAD(P)-dependent dehydrogenase (short-subunit alcohol dehydrogenase family)